MSGGDGRTPAQLRGWAGRGAAAERASERTRWAARQFIACGALWAFGASGAFGQTLGDLQEEIRESLGNTEFASYFAVLGLAASEYELSGGSLEVDGTRLNRFALPYRRRWLEDDDRLGFYAEGVLGFARAKESAEDIYSGAVPGFETSVEADWTTAGGLVGIGPIVRPAPDLTATWVASVGLAHLESRARYAGPGAAVTQALLDGIGFNWEAWAGTVGSAARLDWTRQLSSALQAEAVLRYDLRWSRTLETDDPAQDFASRLQVLTLRGDLFGPTRWRCYGRTVDWRCYAGWQRFTEGSLLGETQIFELGAGLELGLPAAIPWLREAVLNGALLLGEELSGWSLGVSFGL